MSIFDNIIQSIWYHFGTFGTLLMYHLLNTYSFFNL